MGIDCHIQMRIGFQITHGTRLLPAPQSPVPSLSTSVSGTPEQYATVQQLEIPRNILPSPSVRQLVDVQDQ